MGTVFKIAFRNILRHKRRTVTSAVVISVGLMFYIFMDSVMAGLDRGGIDNMIELSTSAVKVHTDAYEEDREALPLEHGIGNMDRIREFLGGNRRVVGITPRTMFLGQLSNYEQTVPVMGTVVDPETDTTVFSLTRYLNGSYFTQGAARQIILGSELAEEMGVGVGDYITLYALTRFESHNADEFEIVGTLTTTDPTINISTALISFEAANDFLDLGGLITEVDIALERRVNFRDMAADAGEVKAALDGAFPSLHTVTFMEQAESFLELAKSKRGFGIVFLAVVLLIAGVGIFNTVLMSVYERIREIGVLRAHGMRPRQVSLMFALEGLLTGLIGSGAGTILGIAVNWVLVVYGYPIDKIAGDMDTMGLPYWGTVYGEWNIGTIAAMFAFGVITATIAGLIPARKGGKMEVTRALRFV
jgi:ABC-type lipoprotein release transport system permease subunit